MPVEDVRLLRVGEVQVRPDNVAGGWRPMLLWTATALRWTDWLPVHVVLVRHSTGLVLFDTGQSPRSLTARDYYPRGLLGWVYRRQARFRVAAGLRDVLAAEGVDADDVETVVLSHLHQDHAGNLADVPAARVVLTAAEHALLAEPTPELHGVLADHVAPPGTRFDPVDATDLTTLAELGLADALAPFTHGHDVLGDRSLVLLPTPGHTPGSASLYVDRPERPLLLVGDLTYDPALVPRGRVPGTGATALQKQSTARVAALLDRRPEIGLVAAHDPRARV